MESLKILQIPNDCTGCGACVNICPKKCLTLSPDKEGFYFPQYDSTNCIDCGLCEKTCHILASNNNHLITKDNFFIYRSDNIELLEQSSSGGAFSLFADYVLWRGGVVFGSRYNADIEKLEIICSEDYPISEMRKSKYIESFTGNSFKKVKDYLTKDKLVLFCGTPCQVRGLKKYLELTKTNQDKLISVDFVCHGVPSNKCFTAFKHMEERSGERIVNADFRYKKFSKNIYWHHMTLGLEMSNGRTRIISPFHLSYYYYYLLFLKDLILRKSCYSCNYVLSSAADVTIGDFWGVVRYKPEIDDNRGLSFIKVHNEKILPIIKQIPKGSTIEPMPFEPNERQYSHRDSTNVIPTRDQFFEQIAQMGLKQAVDKYFHLTPLTKIKITVIGRMKFLAKKLICAFQNK